MKLRHQKQAFLSPTGVVRFKSDDGVDVTNTSSDYIKPNDASEYYGSVLGQRFIKRQRQNIHSMCLFMQSRNADVTKIHWSKMRIRTLEKSKCTWIKEGKRNT